jgi:hypothetical protein
MRFCLFLTCIALIFELGGCKKQNTATVADLNGTWNYSGYSGGFGGLQFTPVSSEGPYIQIKDSQFLITTGVGKSQKCMHFSPVKDSLSDLYQISGVLTVADTSFMFPQPSFSRFLLSLDHDQLSLSPLECSDCFTNTFRRINSTFKWCN